MTPTDRAENSSGGGAVILFSPVPHFSRTFRVGARGEELGLAALETLRTEPTPDAWARMAPSLTPALSRQGDGRSARQAPIEDAPQ
jgi:hypothetical protein